MLTRVSPRHSDHELRGAREGFERDPAAHAIRTIHATVHDPDKRRGKYPIIDASRLGDGIGTHLGRLSTPGGASSPAVLQQRVFRTEPAPCHRWQEGLLLNVPRDGVRTAI